MRAACSKRAALNTCTHSSTVLAACEALAPDLYDRRSQEVPALWLPTGGAFVAPAARVRAGGALQAPPFAIVPVPAERALDIDVPADLVRARELARSAPSIRT